ncbi:hypothetical protein ACVIW2_002393 [Bradyrhizobium huanghuaihaiense]
MLTGVVGAAVDDRAHHRFDGGSTDGCTAAEVKLPADAAHGGILWLLDRLVNDKPGRQKTLSHCLVEIARFGDYLARACDPPPGNTVI